MPTSLDLRAERARIWEGAKALLAQAEADNRNFTAEEQASWDRHQADIDDLTGRIERQEAAELRDRELTADPTFTGAPTRDETDSYDEAFSRYLLRGEQGLNAEQRGLLAERRDTTPQGTTPDSAGGYLVPEGFVNDVIEALKAYGGVRNFGQVLPTTSGGDLPYPTIDETGEKGARIDENSLVDQSDMTFGSVALKAFTYTSKIIKVSLQLLQDEAVNVEGRLPTWLGTRIARITNEEFTTGNGTGQPQGVVTAAPEGHEATGAGITWPDLVELVHSVDPAYRDLPTCQWMFSDAFLKAAKLLKDGEDRPLWTPGIAVREPDTLMGYRYTINQDVAAPAAGQKSAVFGDGSAYIIRDVRAFTLLRLTERYADYLQVGFLGFSRHDGRAVFANTTTQAPFKHLAHPSGS